MAEMNVPPSKKAKLIVVSEDDKILISLVGEEYFASLAYGSEV